MAIADAGVPSTHPHTMLKALLEDNMTSPDGVWTPSVNANWLDHKKQKTYQISITPLYSDSVSAHLTGGTSTTEPRIVDAYWIVHLYAPSRDNLWSLYQKTLDVLNNGSLTSPQSGGTYSGVGSTDYHFVKVVRAEQVKTIEMREPDCGIDNKESEYTGYRAEITVCVRWNE